MGHINGESPLLNPTGIQFVTKSMLVTTNEEHRKLMGLSLMRSGFNSRQGIHDLIAIATLALPPRAIVETDDISHENTFSVARLGSLVWLHPTLY